MKTAIAQIQDGFVNVYDNRDNRVGSFPLTPQGGKSYRKFMAEEDFENILYSSTVDFPEEYGTTAEFLRVHFDIM